MSTSIIAPRPRGAPGQPFGGRQRDDRQHDGDDGEAQRLRVAARHLRERVDGERQRLGLAGNVRDEGDRRAELAQPARERQQRSGDDARHGKRQRDGSEYPEARAAERPRRDFEPLVDGFDRQPDRAHHQREAHQRRRERRAGPAEREHDPEPFVEQAPDGAALAEEHQQRKADDHRRQHERKVDDRIDHRLPGKRVARQSIGDGDRDRQAAENADHGHPEAQRQDSDLVRAETRHRLSRRPRSRISPRSARAGAERR